MLKASCPRVAVCFEAVHNHMMSVSVGGISCTGTVDKTSFEQLRKAHVYMDIALQVDSLQVRA